MQTVIDAEDCIAGRLASYVAKRLLKGEEIVIVNAEKSVVSGNPKAIQEFFFSKIKKGDPYHGPFYPKQPDRILRRIVRGMLPFHKAKGREAYERLKVFVSVPKDFEGRNFEVIEKTRNKLECKFITLKEISEKFGVKMSTDSKGV
jgi:large subunit ribosomal protein L13